MNPRMARARSLPRREQLGFQFHVTIGDSDVWSRQEVLEAVTVLLAVYEARHGMTSAEFWRWSRETPWELARPLTLTEMRWMTWYDISRAFQ